MKPQDPESQETLSASTPGSILGVPEEPSTEPGAGAPKTSSDSADRREAMLRHLEELRDGVHGTGPHTLDLQRLNLIEANLSGINLAGSNLTGTDLSRANLERTVLLGAVLENAVLFQANLERTELSGADLRGANLQDVSAESAGLGHAQLDGACLLRAELTNATLTEASLVGANLQLARLDGARLRDADLSRADLSRSSLRHADLTGATVKRATLSDSDLRSARLSGVRGYSDASWVRSDFREADFSNAHLCRRFILDQNYLEEFRNQNRMSQLVYKVWWLTSDCGRSLTRWGLLTFAIALAFAAMYTRADLDYGDHDTPLSPLYFSIVTLTTLGYGDVVPASTGAQVLCLLEVILGYVMLGGLLSIFATKMARRAD